MKILTLIISFQLLGLSFGLKCYECPFDGNEIEKPCALDPSQADVTECNIRANACLTATGESKSQSGNKKVQYTQCGRMKPLEDLDEDNCEDGTRGSLSVKTCYCQEDLCNKPDQSSSTWIWILVVVVVVLIIGAVAGFIIWKLKFSNKGEISKEEPKTEGESVPLKSQEPSGEDQKSQENP